MSESKAGKSRRGITAMYIILAVIITLIVLMFIVNNVVFMRVDVVGDSMNNTLYNGEVVIASKKAKPKRNNIVVIANMKFDDAGKSELIIKRLIAVGGDEIKFENGFFFLKKNGESEFNSMFELENGEDLNTYFENGKVYAVEQGKGFFLGDNRKDSQDSRHYGFCDIKKDIKGVVPSWAVSIKKVSTFVTKKIVRPIRSIFTRSSCGC